ncbi:fumarylacetoacetate hydrolase family protein [Acidovorax sp. JG5]|uniref:fumarylacetoacetate hydrolase family protein n=1 Tax=Acidovorax sp. JG5 TaxID=2822718 RepID=UPI001B31F3D8|nr:fumarylacetoacetate hydrolase family protein [Acidovorax sp. JG5]MBP3979544.1 fumarylacetoacetate hydrolase family protein [Acidovorax sp. JG5]
MKSQPQRLEMRRILRNGRAQTGRYADGVIHLPDGSVVREVDAVHLPPCEPSKIICVHLNYDDRRIEIRQPHPEPAPSYFFKPPTSLNAHEGVVYRPIGTKYLNYEGEIGVVIGAEARGVTREQAHHYVRGYVAANDIGCHDFRDIDRGSMLRVKGMDGFSPIGPGLVSGIDIRQSRLRTYVNGQLVQDASAVDMVFGIDYLIADLSRYMTLLPGDLILTGTPAHSRPMNPGDLVEVEVTGVGRLRNRIAEAQSQAVTVGHAPTDTPQIRHIALGGETQ